MRTRYWIPFIAVAMLVLGILVFRTVPIPNEEDCAVVKGMVVDITEGGTKDIVFRIAGLNRIFYVNRGLERGLDLDELRAQLLNKEITIKYPRYWTPLGNSSKHISKIEFSGRTIFTEID